MSIVINKAQQEKRVASVSKDKKEEEYGYLDAVRWRAVMDRKDAFSIIIVLIQLLFVTSFDEYAMIAASTPDPGC